MALELTSDVFQHNTDIPALYTCQGKDISPPIAWSGAPDNTQSFALIVEDPDAPDPKAPKMTWVHWVLYNIPANVSSLSENVTAAQLPNGTLSGLNSWDKTTYGGPCPPIGKHRYFHKLYALDIKLPDLKQPTAEKLRKHMEGHIIAETQIIGLYQKG